MAAKARTASQRKAPSGAAPRSVHRTHYETLDVTIGATGAEIRSAYLALIKRHHPDVSGNSDTARAINLAYRALSNPARRGSYDATLGIAHPIVLRPLPLVPPIERRRTRWGSRIAALSLLAVAACYFVYARQAPAREPQATANAAFDLPDRDVTRSGRAAIVQQAGLNFEWVALQSDVTAAERYSQQCWDSVLTSGSDGLFDYCLAFDAIAERTFGSERVYFANAALLNRARAIGSGRLAAGETLKQRIARIDALLARERRADDAPAPVTWFPLPGAPVPQAR